MIAVYVNGCADTYVPSATQFHLIEIPTCLGMKTCSEGTETSAFMCCVIKL